MGPKYYCNSYFNVPGTSSEVIFSPFTVVHIWQSSSTIFVLFSAVVFSLFCLVCVGTDICTLRGHKKCSAHKVHLLTQWTPTPASVTVLNSLHCAREIWGQLVASTTPNALEIPLDGDAVPAPGNASNALSFLSDGSATGRAGGTGRALRSHVLPSCFTDSTKRKY